jgi:hypothetical protein
METITIKTLTLSLNRDIQTTPQGKNIRYSGLEHHGNQWHYYFNFIGTNDFIKFIFVNNNYINYIC